MQERWNFLQIIVIHFQNDTSVDIYYKSNSTATSFAMSVRKKLQNRDKFQFDENDVLPPPPKAVVKQSSVQARLFKKVGAGPSFSPRSNYSEPGKSQNITLKRSAVAEFPAAVGIRSNKDFDGLNNNDRQSLKSRQVPGNTQVIQDPVLQRIVSKLKADYSAASSVGSSKGSIKSGTGGFTNNAFVGEKGSCICDRPLRLVMCSLCGGTYPGRVALQCKDHPRAVFLQDLKFCSSCKRGSVEKMKEFDLPDGMKEVLIGINKR